MTSPKERAVHWKSKLGLLAELRAAQWLLEQGFWTFLPVGGFGPIDLIAVSKTGKVHLFDVKSASRRSSTGYIVSRKLSTFQRMIGVRLLYVDTETNEVFLTTDRETAKTFGFAAERRNKLPNK